VSDCHLIVRTTAQCAVVASDTARVPCLIRCKADTPGRTPVAAQIAQGKRCSLADRSFDYIRSQSVRGSFCSCKIEVLGCLAPVCSVDKAALTGICGEFLLVRCTFVAG